jgi:hypothetical protein
MKHGQTHGNTVSSVYRAYYNAKDRCQNPDNRAFKNYGGRGIKFLFSSFEEWLKELGPKPNKGLSVDRRNNDGNYEIGNMRWATRREQFENSRRVHTCS